MNVVCMIDKNNTHTATPNKYCRRAACCVSTYQASHVPLCVCAVCICVCSKWIIQCTDLHMYIEHCIRCTQIPYAVVSMCDVELWVALSLALYSVCHICIAQCTYAQHIMVSVHEHCRCELHTNIFALPPHRFFIASRHAATHTHAIITHTRARFANHMWADVLTLSMYLKLLVYYYVCVCVCVCVWVISYLLSFSRPQQQRKAMNRKRQDTRTHNKIIFIRTLTKCMNILYDWLLLCRVHRV